MGARQARRARRAVAPVAPGARAGGRSSLTGALLAAALFFAPEPVLELDQVLDEVGRAAPAVEVDRAALAVARAAIGVAGAWQDPTVTVMGEALRLPGTMPEEHPMLTYRLTQELNLFGRRGAAKRRARAGVAGREALLRRTIWDARAQATGLFFELWMLDRVRAGMAMGHHDALGAEAEIARMEAERSSLDDERAAMAAMLNTLRGHADDPSVPRVGLPKRAAVPRLDALAGKAASTPEVTAARAMRGEAEAKRELAKKMYLPMVSLEAMYEQRLEGERDTWGEVAMAEAMIGAHGARRTRCARWPRPSSAWPGAGCAPRTGG